MTSEPLIRQIVKSYLQKLNISFPAKVTSVENLKDGFVSVQPLVNDLNELTRNTYQYPELRDIRVVFPSTKTSSFTIPVSVDDLVQVEMQSVNIERFLNGNTEPHDPSFTGFGNLRDCVIKIGFEPFQQSCMNPNNYQNDFDNQNLNIVHNKNTDNEVTFSLTTDGDVRVITKSKVILEGVEELDCGNALVKTTNDVEINGISVFKNITTHDHSYTDDGSPMITAPPNIK